MVSLIARSDYLSQCRADSYVSHFANFLLGIDFDIRSEDPLIDANDIAIFALKAIEQNQSQMFKDAFDVVSRRRPRRESDWLHNDMLLFSCTLGVAKFGLEESWLREVLDFRRQFPEQEKSLVAQTFLDVLNKNYESTGNCRPLMLVIRSHLSLSLGRTNDLNTMYNDLICMPFPFFRSPFLNLVSLRAIDLIILSREPVDTEHLQRVGTFITKFRKRIRQIGNTIWTIIFIGSITGSIWFAYYFIRAEPQVADKLDRLLTILPFLGFGGLVPALLVFRSGVLRQIDNMLFWYYGFDRELSSLLSDAKD